MLGDIKIPRMLLPILPVRALQSKAIPDGFGHSLYGLWGNPLYWEPAHQFTRNLSISIQANKTAFHGALLSLLLLSGEIPCFTLPWDRNAGALPPLGTHNPILPAVLRKPEPVLKH